MNDFINKTFNLNKKLAIVVGGGGHICSELAISLAKAGCYVFILDIRKEKFELIKKKVNDRLILKNLHFYKFDALRKSEYLRIIKIIKKRFNRFDILINGSGINSPQNYEKITLKDWNKVIQSHLDSTFLGCQLFGYQMLKKKSGSIINISSASSGPPLSKAFAYSVAKSGIKNLTQNLAREWANKGVRVNAIRPGFFPTEWNKRNFIDSKREKKILEHTPMNRFGNPDELISTIIWLASNSSSFVTGAEIPIDGGFSCMTI